MKPGSNQGSRDFKTSRFDGKTRDLPFYQRYLQRELKALNGVFIQGPDRFPPYLSNEIGHKLANGIDLTTNETKEMREHREECKTRDNIAEKGITLIRNTTTDEVFDKFLAVESDDRNSPIQKCRIILQILDQAFRGTQRQQNLIIESIKKETDQYCKPASSPKEAEVRLGCLKAKEQELIYFADGSAKFTKAEIEPKVVTILDEVQFMSTVMRITQQGFQDVGDILTIFKDEMASVRGYSEGKTAREHSLEETTAPISIQSFPTTTSSSQPSAISSPIVAAAMTQPFEDMRRGNDSLRRDVERLQRERAQSPTRFNSSRQRDDSDRQGRYRDERDRNGRSPSRERRDDRRNTPHWTEDRARRSPSRADDFQQFQQWQQWQKDRRQPPPPSDGYGRPPPQDGYRRSGSPHPRREDGGRSQYFSSRR